MEKLKGHSQPDASATLPHHKYKTIRHKSEAVRGDAPTPERTPCPHIRKSGHEWETRCDDCGQIWPNMVNSNDLIEGAPSPRESPLPDFDSCEAAVKRGNPTALERFIFNNEPAGLEETKNFRRELTAVLEDNNAH